MKIFLNNDNLRVMMSYNQHNIINNIINQIFDCPIGMIYDRTDIESIDFFMKGGNTALYIDITLAYDESPDVIDMVKKKNLCINTDSTSDSQEGLSFMSIGHFFSKNRIRKIGNDFFNATSIKLWYNFNEEELEMWDRF